MWLMSDIEAAAFIAIVALMLALALWCRGELAMTRSTRPHVFVQHHQHPGQKQKHHANNGMAPQHEGHPKDCNDESNQCHPAISKAAFAIRWKIRKRRPSS